MNEQEYLTQLNSGKIRNKEAMITEHEELLRLHKLSYGWLVEEMEIQKELFNIINNNSKPCKLEFEYQKNEDYWKCQKSLRQIDFNRKMEEKKTNINRLSSILKIKEEELKRIKWSGL